MAVTYRLKDRAFQEKLDELTDGNFSGLIAETMSEDNGLSPHISVDCGEWINPHANERLAIYRFRVFFRKDEIEAVPVYDPKAWNDYPAVKPPEGIWMRLEFTGNGVRRGHRMMYSRGEWVDGATSIYMYNDVRDARFRPWDDDESER